MIARTLTDHEVFTKIADFIRQNQRSSSPYFREASATFNARDFGDACNCIALYYEKMEDNEKNKLARADVRRSSTDWLELAAALNDPLALERLGERHQENNSSLAADLYLQAWITAKIYRHTAFKDAPSSIALKESFQKELVDILKSIIAKTSTQSHCRLTAQFALCYIECKQKSNVESLINMRKALSDLKPLLNPGNTEEQYAFSAKQALLVESLEEFLDPKNANQSTAEQREKAFEMLFELTPTIRPREHYLPYFQKIYDALPPQDAKEDDTKLKRLLAFMEVSSTSAPHKNIELKQTAHTKQDAALPASDSKAIVQIRSDLYMRLTNKTTLTLTEKHHLCRQVLTVAADSRRKQIELLHGFQSSMDSKTTAAKVAALCSTVTDPALMGYANYIIDRWSDAKLEDALRFLDTMNAYKINYFSKKILDRFIQKWEHRPEFALNLSQFYLNELINEHKLETDQPETFATLSFEQLVEIVSRFHLLPTELKKLYKLVETLALVRLIGIEEYCERLSDNHPLTDHIKILTASNNPKEEKEFKQFFDQDHPVALYFALQRSSYSSPRKTTAFCKKILECKPSDVCLPRDFLSHIKEFALDKLSKISTATISTQAEAATQEEARKMLSLFAQRTSDAFAPADRKPPTLGRRP